MAKMEAEILIKYEELLRKDPFSKAFAPLADAYLEIGKSDKAEVLLREGVRRHPEFSPGLVIYAKLLRQRGQLQGAFDILKKASRLSSDNLSAYQMMGEIALDLKRPQEALKALKMVLFINPKAQKAAELVQKLESLSALDFDEETFAFARLKDFKMSRGPQKGSPEVSSLNAAHAARPSKEGSENFRTGSKALQRMLSLIDAFIVRNDLVKASDLIQECEREFGPQAELKKRESVVKSRGFSSHLSQASEDEALPLEPLESREKMVLRHKLEVLQGLLKKISLFRDLSSPS